MSAKRFLQLALRYALLTAVALLILYPLYIIVVNSLLPSARLAQVPPRFFPQPAFQPGSWEWQTYGNAWSKGNLANAAWVSIVVAFLVVVGQVITAILAGYAFAFLEFPLKKVIFVVFLATLMIPIEVTFLENLSVITDLGLYNTYAGLALPFMATGLGAFLLRQAFLTVPKDLQDAARLDGFGHLRFMFRVAVPLVRPTVAALTVFAFLGAWSQYLWPLVASSSKGDRWTIQIALRNLLRTNLANINVTFAGIVIALIPTLILLLFFQKQLVRGLTAGAVKG